jgi:hypothetical protein
MAESSRKTSRAAPSTNQAAQPHIPDGITKGGVRWPFPLVTQKGGSRVTAAWIRYQILAPCWRCPSLTHNGDFVAMLCTSTDQRSICWW